MMDVNQFAARDYWNALPAAERQKILEALKADLALVAHEYTGLAPELQAGIVKGMPVEPPHKPPGGRPPHDEADDAPPAKKKG